MQVWNPIIYNGQAGGIAGTTVDIVLFPLDTIKTRLQSKIGFWAAGGFKSIYAGIGPAAAGSAPSGNWMADYAMPVYLQLQEKKNSVVDAESGNHCENQLIFSLPISCYFLLHL